MNPWEIVSWIGAASVGILIIVFTISITVALAKKPKGKTTRIL